MIADITVGVLGMYTAGIIIRLLYFVYLINVTVYDPWIVAAIKGESKECEYYERRARMARKVFVGFVLNPINWFRGLPE